MIATQSGILRIPLEPTNTGSLANSTQGSQYFNKASTTALNKTVKTTGGDQENFKASAVSLENSSKTIDQIDNQNTTKTTNNIVI